MRELEVIQYLLDELKQDIEYKNNYEIEQQKATKQANTYNRENDINDWRDKKGFWNFMPSEYTREPNNAIIKQNSMKIRKLLLKLYK